MVRFCAAVFAFVLLPLSALAQEATAPVKQIVARKIVLVGDSTTAVQGGWGPSFCGYHVTSFVACVNLARGGRSSGNYRAEGSWDIALNEMKAPGFAKVYVLIQFGHNDQPGKPGRSTDLATEFPANLARYVAETREAGAIPILVTPLTRRMFKDGVLTDDLRPWAEAAIKVAQETDTPLIDLNKLSHDAVQAMGAVEATKLAEMPPSEPVLEAAKTGTTISAKTGVASKPDAKPMTQAEMNAAAEPMGQPKIAFDYTHLGREGADYFSAMVTRALAQKVPELRKNLIP